MLAVVPKCVVSLLAPHLQTVAWLAASIFYPEHSPQGDAGDRQEQNRGRHSLPLPWQGTILGDASGDPEGHSIGSKLALAQQGQCNHAHVHGSSLRSMLEL